MNITIFGSTGKTGALAVKEALDAGHRVTAFARTPEKLAIDHPNLQIVQGDALDPAAVRKAVEGADGVISFLGVNPKSKEYSFCTSIENVITAMKAHGVKRLVMSAGAGVGDENDAPTFMGKLMGGIIKLVAKTAFEDGLRTAQMVREVEDIDWTMVRVPMLTDRPAGEKALRIGYLGKGTGPQLSRADLAHFMITEIQDRTYLHQAPVISN